MKKDETRFTIRFNPADPRHKKVMEALEAAGRRKATLIADAVYEYLSRHMGDGAASTFPLAPAPFVASAHALYSDTAESRVTENDISLQIPEPGDDIVTSANSALEDVFDNEMREAILGGLSAFKM